MRWNVVPIEDLPEDERAELPFGGGWPEFIFHDPIASAYIDRANELFAAFNLVVLDDERSVVAGGWAVPIAWSGSLEALPGGWDDALATSVDQHAADVTPNTLCTMAAEVTGRARRRGIGGLILETLKRRAQEHGLRSMIAPVRPTLKSRYPLTPIERYARWQRDDGTPFDPWLRTHARVGGAIVATTTRSMRIEGTVGDWEDWTGMAFPDTGRYVVPDALEVVTIDRERDQGVYVEPAVWIRHL